jgi:hypothetical protein
MISPAGILRFFGNLMFCGPTVLCMDPQKRTPPELAA